jgi:hypothetical protein
MILEPSVKMIRNPYNEIHYASLFFLSFLTPSPLIFLSSYLPLLLSSSPLIFLSSYLLLLSSSLIFLSYLPLLSSSLIFLYLPFFYPLFLSSSLLISSPSPSLLLASFSLLPQKYLVSGHRLVNWVSVSEIVGGRDSVLLSVRTLATNELLPNKGTIFDLILDMVYHFVALLAVYFLVVISREVVASKSGPVLANYCFDGNERFAGVSVTCG